jgi:hypothetical protein
MYFIISIIGNSDSPLINFNILIRHEDTVSSQILHVNLLHKIYYRKIVVREGTISDVNRYAGIFLTH